MRLRAADRDVHARFVATAAEFAPELEAAIARVGPLRVPVDAHMPLAERLCRSIVGQQLSVKAARTIWARLLADAGDAALVDHLLRTPPDTLRACGVSGSKARALRGIAERTADGTLDAARLSRLDHAERSAELTALWGVGQWTVDMLSIFWFGDDDVWPDGDVVARKTLARLTSPRRSTVRTAARFAPHRSRLAIYMWRWRDATPG